MHKGHKHSFCKQDQTLLEERAVEDERLVLAALATDVRAVLGTLHTQVTHR